MYSLVIAEDEFTTRRALVNMVRWNELGFRKESGVILILEKICGCPIGKAWKWDTTIMTLRYMRTKLSQRAFLYRFRI